MSNPEIINLLDSLKQDSTIKAASLNLKSKQPAKAILKSLLREVQDKKGKLLEETQLDIVHSIKLFLNGPDLELCHLAWLTLVNSAEKGAEELLEYFTAAETFKVELPLQCERVMEIAVESDDNILFFVHAILVSISSTDFSSLIFIFTSIEKIAFASTGLSKKIALSVLLKWFYLIINICRKSNDAFPVLKSNSVFTRTATWIADNFGSNSNVPKAMVKELFGLVVDLLTKGAEYLQEEIQIIADLICCSPDPKVAFELLRYWPFPSTILETNPEILSSAFTNLAFPFLESCSADFISSFTKAIYIQGLQDKFNIVERLNNGLKSNNLHVRKSISDKILPGIGKYAPELYEELITALKKDSNFGQMMPIYVAAKMNGINLDRGNLMAVLSETIVSANPQLRFSTLSFIVLSLQSAKDVEKDQLYLVKQYLQVSAFGEQLSMRQEIKNQIFKFLERIKRFRYRNLKDIAQLERKLKDGHDQLLETKKQELQRAYEEKADFVEWFFRFSIYSFFPGSSLHRTVTAISYLNLTVEIEALKINSDEKHELNSFARPFRKLSDHETEILFFQLFGSLSKGQFLEFAESAHVDFTRVSYSMERKCIQLLQSVKVSDVDAGVTFSSLFMNEKLNLRRAMNRVEFYEELILRLEAHITNYSDSEQSRRNFPLNGLLSSLLAIISSVGSELPGSSLFKLFSICKKAIDVTLFAVSEIEDTKIISPILLRDCFRTVKESCSLMYEIGNLLPSNNEYFTDLVRYYTHLMTVVRHPGSFSSIEINLEKICRKIGERNDPKDRELLSCWLTEFLETFQKLELSVTRRSASIPNAILAVILGSKSQKLEFISLTIDTCFKIISDSKKVVRDERVDMIQVHALNIARVLVSNSELSSYVEPYIEQCFAVCLEQFASSYFPIRNCAAMLFTALISKALGSRKSKSHFEQLTTSARFFENYPKLYQLLLDQLQLALELQEGMKKDLHPSFVPILNLLSKLKPASKSLSMEPFEQLLSKSSRSRHWVVRQLAANTLSLLIAPSRILQTVSGSISRLLEDRSANTAHGVALQILSILSQHSRIQDHLKGMDLMIFKIRFLLEDSYYSVARAVLLEAILEYGIKLKAISLSDEMKELAIKASYKILEGSLSIHFCPSSCLDVAAFVAFSGNSSNLIDFNSLLRISKLEDSHNLQSVMGALAKLPQAYITGNFNAKNHIINSALSVINCKEYSPYLIANAINLFCKIENPSQYYDVIKESLHSFLLNSYTPQELDQALLLITTEILIERSSDCVDLWDHFVPKCIRAFESDQPAVLKLSVVDSIARLLPILSVNDAQFVHICILVDNILCDDEDEIRDMGCIIVAKFLNLKDAKAGVVSRFLFCEKVSTLLPSNDSWIMYHVDIVCKSNPSKIKANLGSQILFDMEEWTDYREPLIQTLQSTKFLSLMLDKLEESDRSFLDVKGKIAVHLKTCLNVILEFSSDDLYWISNDVFVFNALVETICCDKLLKSSSRDADLACLHVHPLLSLLRSSNGWNMLNDLFLFRQPDLKVQHEAPLLRGIDKNSFAFETISNRFPSILTKIIDCLLQNEFDLIYDKSLLIKDISGLKYQISRNFKLPESDLVLVLPESQRTWFEGPWLFVECLLYLILHDYAAMYATDSKNPPDLFGVFKRESIRDSLEAIQLINQQMLNLDHSNQNGTLEKLILISLWGNQSDLSLNFKSLKDRGNEKPVIVDDTALIIPKLQNCKSQVTIILDNAGFELYSDLCLAEYICESHGCTVVFEAKSIPWFVSDTTRHDFDILFQVLSEESENLKIQVDKWKGFLKTSKWIIRANKFWTSCKTFWELPQERELFAELCESEFLILKGDLNYRKMVHDAKWPTETPFEEAIGPLKSSAIPPFVMLRTCKADTCAGLKPGQESLLNSTDPNWMVNGKFGMIQSYS